MARLVETLRFDKPATLDPVPFEGFSTTLTSLHYAIVHFYVDSNTFNTALTGFDRFTSLDTGALGAAFIGYELRTGIESVTELDFNTIADGIFDVFIYEGLDQTVSAVEALSHGELPSSLTQTTGSTTSINNNSLYIEAFALDGNRVPKDATFSGEGVIVHSGAGEDVTSVTGFTSWGFAKNTEALGGNTITMSSTDGGGYATYCLRDANPANPTYIPLFRKGVESTSVQVGVAVDATTLATFFPDTTPILRTKIANATLDAPNVDLINNNVPSIGHGYSDFHPVYFRANGGTLPPLVDGTKYLVDKQGDDLAFRTLNTVTEITLSAGTGAPFIEDAGVLYDDGGLSGVGGIKNEHSPATTTIGGATLETSLDSTNETLLFSQLHTAIKEMNTLEKLGAGIILKSLNGWKVYNASGIDVKYSPDVTHDLYLNLSAATERGTVGTFDSTAITHVFLASTPSAPKWTPRSSIGSISLLRTPIFTGGTSAEPFSFLDIEEISRAVTVSGDAVVVLNQAIQIGSPDYDTFFEDLKGSTATLLPSDETVDPRVQVIAQTFNLTIHSTAGSKIPFKRAIICEDFVAQGDYSPDNDFNGLTIFASTRVLLPSWWNYRTIFDECPLIEHNDCDLSNSCRVQNSTRSEGALILTATVNTDNVVWDNNPYHFEIDETGKGQTFTLTGHTYTNSTTADINPSFETATTTTTTINVAGGGDTPTVDPSWTDNGGGNYTKGNATINIVSGATLSIFTQDGNEVRIRQGSFTLDHVQNVTGGVFNYAYSSGAGKTVRITVGASGFERREVDYVLPSTDSSLFLELDPSPSYI